MYSDDIDLSFMALQKGKSNYYFHETTVIHYKGESTVKDGIYMKRFQQAMNFFYKKHFKVSVFFSIFMKVGIVFFSFVKMFQGKPKQKNKPDNYIVISNNQKLQDKLEKQFKKRVKLEPLSQSFSQNKDLEVIFDNNVIDFKTIIQILETNKNKKITFKILPQFSDFIIGSNSSNDRGEVIQVV